MKPLCIIAVPKPKADMCSAKANVR